MVMTKLRNNADFSTLPNDHPARAYKNIQNRLSIDRDEQGNEVMLKERQKIDIRARNEAAERAEKNSNKCTDPSQRLSMDCSHLVSFLAVSSVGFIF